MAESKNSIVQRIALEGVEDIAAKLAALGVTGEAAVAKIQTAVVATAAAGGGLGKLNSITASLAAGFARVGTAIEPVGAALGELGTAGGKFGGAIEDVGKRVGVAALAIGGAGLAVLEFGKSSADSVIETVNLARSLGMTVDGLEKLRLVGARAGVDQDKLDIALGRFTVALGKAREAQDKLTGSIGDGATVLRGGVTAAAGSVAVLRGGADKLNDSLNNTTTVFHGSTKAALDFSNPFKALKINVAAYADTAAGNNQVMTEAARRLIAMGDSAIKASIAQQLFGRGWRLALPIFVDLQAKLALAGKAIEFFGIGISKQEIGQAQAFRSSLAVMETVIGRVKDMVGNTLGQALVPVFDGITTLIGNNASALKAWAQSIVDAAMPAILDFVKMLEGAADKDIGTKWLITLRGGVISFKNDVVAAVPTVVAAFRAVADVLGFIAGAINAVFGTHLNALALGAIVILGSLSGVFAAVGAAIGVVTAAVGVLTAVVEGMGIAFGIATAPMWLLVAAFAAVAVVIIANWTGMVGFLKTAWQGFGEIFAAVGALISDTWNNATKGITDTWSDAVGLVKSAWGALSGWFSGQIDELVAFFKPLIDVLKSVIALMGVASGAGGSSGAAAAGAGAAGMAGGGPVYGAGTSTSDSVPIRASVGEYVVKAAAVSKYGLGVMAAINSMRLAIPQGFSLGGLVGALNSVSSRPLSLASGGAVVASGGGGQRPFNLVIGGHTFAGLLAPAVVGEKMVAFAQSSALRSTGAKPSWYRG